MSLRVKDVMGVLERLAPREIAYGWDNPGLLLGRSEKEVRKIFVVLDVTAESAEAAIQAGCDLIVAHHPVIFHGIQAVNDLSGAGRKLLNLLQADIAVYAMHTNFDLCPEGMGAIVCKRLGFQNLGPMELLGDFRDFAGKAAGAAAQERQAREGQDAQGDGEAQPYGLGFVAELPDAMDCGSLAGLVKERFSLPFLLYYDAGRPIKRLACCPGSGRGEFKQLLDLRADAYLTGDMGHHDALDLLEEGISLLDAGHYGLEHIFIEYVADYLRCRCDGIEVLEKKAEFPAKIL